MLLLLALPLAAVAGPVAAPVVHRALGSDDNNDIPVSTWIPIAVVLAVLVLLSICLCSRKTIRARLAGMGHGVSLAAGAAAGVPPPRELTADQLAGSINRAPARPRRPRHTPSQISTVSLPAYMKEPGEQELVVSRGPGEEDVTMPPAHAEEDEDSRDGHGTHTRYSPMPHSPNDAPLLAFDPRGAAPAYFEVLEPQEYAHQQDDDYTAPPPDNAAQYPPPGIPDPPRRSGFFSFFDSSANALTHARTRSTTTTHRPSASVSTLFSIVHQRSSVSLARTNTHNNSTHTLVRSASRNNLASPGALTSPSHTSLISAPLPHTLLKTEFTALPKGGLTPEQLSLISGTKEGGLGRFGVPWGEAAVAYAQANGSRVNLASGSHVDLTEGAPPRQAGRRTRHPPHHPPRQPHCNTPRIDIHTSRGDARTALAAARRVARLGRSVSMQSVASMQSFATAEEGAASDEEEEPREVGGDDREEHERPTTSHTHAQEATDATVRPGAAA
ncbi:hypothetical protein B0H10DRAFT_2436767 [Mycena sp. CBHHK59/15]|nr:hypothetical protein B0H10DRAFT_2436767 [Mycena sp. CBHHK59/15]